MEKVGFSFSLFEKEMEKYLETHKREDVRV